MQEQIVAAAVVDSDLIDESVSGSSAKSAVSWGAILGGAFTAFAVSIFLGILGTGIGLTTVSPWDNFSEIAKTFTVVTGLWLIVVQWLSSAFGGYVAGRLRTKSVRLHTHEVHFRDTTHGFLAWAVATVATVGMAAGLSMLAAAGAATAVTSVASSAAQGAAQGASQNPAASFAPAQYLIDRAFRPANPTAGATPAAPQTANSNAEILAILTYDMARGDVTLEDRTYIAQVISARTGLTPEDAGRRVDELITAANSAKAQALEAADTARKAGAMVSIFSAIALLIGAFIACVTGSYGGKLRDSL